MEIIELGKATPVGGKAKALNDLYHDFKIARGFIIPYDAFLEFLKINSISLEDNLIDIQKNIMKGIFPNKCELLRYFKQHQYHKVIVRSSASLEDGNNYSFAGQFTSYLNTDIHSLILNIKKCWASQFTDNVISYLEKKKIKNHFSFDILVQEMIASDISGVAFSINPTNGCKETLVELSSSSCDKLVNGEIIPRNYHLKDQIIGDEFIQKEQLLCIKENMDRLKTIFKRDIEMEFCFQEKQFYLFQVRPITKVYYSLLDYIEKEYWCSFKNNNWTLFHRSLWIFGATNYKHKSIHNEITEDITLYYPHNQKQIRGFNGNQPPLDEYTIKSHTKEDLNHYIMESYDISKIIKRLSKAIDKNIRDNQFHDFYSNLKKLIQQNAYLNSYEYVIGALGNAFYDQLDKETIQTIENWRNDKRNSYFPIYNKIFKYVHYYFHLDITINSFKNYTSFQELLHLCNKKLKPETITRRIKTREREGFVLLNIHNPKYRNKVITDKKMIQTVQKRFHQLQESILEQNPINSIKGTSTFKNGKIIKGECVVIKDNHTNISNLNLKDKILVCEVTTAKDISYMKDLKALIVNSGGVLCHSAIFSREFNIPCLMGCKIATSYFHTGDSIIYDVDKQIATKIA